MVEVLLVLEIFLTEDSLVEDLLFGAPACSSPACSSAVIFSGCGFNLFSKVFSMTLLGWRKRLIVLFGSSGTTGGCLSKEVWWLKTPVCQILLQIAMRAVITFSPHAWTSSTGMLLTPADFPFFNNCTGASTSLRRVGWPSSVSVWGQFSTDVSPLDLSLYSSEQYSVHRFSIYHSSVRHFPERSWTVVAFPCFTVIKSFTSWYAPLLLFFLRFSTISLHSPIQFSFAFFTHLLMLLIVNHCKHCETASCELSISSFIWFFFLMSKH